MENYSKSKIANPDCNGEVPRRNVEPAKKKRRNKSDLGDNFVAPDGGWGWMVAIASGINTLVTFATAQQFGIIFREHMADLGITNSQLTTIINTQIAVSSMTGLFNGPLFRRFSYRQVGLIGSLLIFVGLFICVFADSFLFYIFSYSCCYGSGRGLVISASAIAINTYFKKKRRTAASYQFGVAGLGPIILPYFATFLLGYVGVRYTVLCFAGLSLNTFACSLVYQPVNWHVKVQDKDTEASKKPTSSDDKYDLNIVQEVDAIVLKNPSFQNCVGPWRKQQQQHLKENDAYKSEECGRLIEDNNDVSKENVPQTALKKKSNSQRVLNGGRSKLEESNGKGQAQVKEEQCKKSFMKNIVTFFDLDLLRDFSYMNLAIGLTLINFVELNFAILTPFILSDFGFGNHQIALVMSLLGVCDLVVRFLVPLITSKIHLSNKAFFAIGLLGMCVGRAVLSFTTDFHILIGVFLWLGLSKGFRTIFWALIIPSHVPLKRLPAAAGIQRLMSGIFCMTCGPLIGLIRDKSSYAVALHFLNLLCLMALSVWMMEFLVRKYRSVNSNSEDVDSE